jgi:hypothetical protein
MGATQGVEFAMDDCIMRQLQMRILEQAQEQGRFRAQQSEFHIVTIRRVR